MSVNKKRVQLWIDALRSGKYEQARGSLIRVVRNSDTTAVEKAYCCLGVACDVYKQNTGDGEWNREQFYCDDDSSVAFLPDAVAEWLGLSPNPKVPRTDNKEISLTAANDNARMNFDQIADLIEQKYLDEDETAQVEL